MTANLVMEWESYLVRLPLRSSHWVSMLTRTILGVNPHTLEASSCTDFALCSESGFTLQLYPATEGLCFLFMVQVNRFAPPDHSFATLEEIRDTFQALFQRGAVQC